MGMWGFGGTIVDLVSNITHGFFTFVETEKGGLFPDKIMNRLNE
jgi:hypothetical protein